jgi:Fe-S-cluster-containing dehydrogenase component
MATIKQYAYLYDATRCIDCRACMLPAALNNVPMNDSHLGSGEAYG